MRGTGIMRRMNPALVIGGSLVLLVLMTALLSLIWTPYDPLHAIPADRMEGPSATHWLGTDRYGRDILSNLMAGSQVTVLVGVIAVGIAVLVGTPLGIWAGMRRGWVEDVTMRGSDILLAFPALLLAIVFGAAFGVSTASALAAIGVASIPGFARVARSGTLQVMSQDYIRSARVSKQNTVTIARRHVLPNIASMLIVQASVTFAIAILAEAALSFLGLGTPPPIPSWGRMLQDAQPLLATNPWLVVWPGVAIAGAVLGFNLLGDGLRDRLDPKLARRQEAAEVGDPIHE